MIQDPFYPFARGQQLTGVPEHPFETTFRNGCLICPYEEMEVQQYPENAGLYLIPLLGEPFELFGRDGCRAAQSWENGYFPVAVHAVDQQGLHWKERTFGVMPEADEVKTGREAMINMVRWTVSNPTGEPRQVVLSLAVCNTFRPPIDTDGTWDKFYWKTFLNRDVVYEILDEEREPAAYPYPLYQKGNCLSVEGKGILLYSREPFTYVAQTDDGGSWKEGTHIAHRVRFAFTLQPGESRTVDYAVPYLPLAEEKLPMLESLSWESAHRRITDLWDKWLSQSSLLDVPGTEIKDAWRAQTATTLMLLDYQNKGAKDLYGRNLIAEWGEGYPDQMLGYCQLSNALYEFVWAQESGYWVLGMLDQQGYHALVEKYMEMFFVMQGSTTPGVHDTSILPPPEVGKAFTGTTIHAWLNSNGGVLAAIAHHYRITHNKQWIIDHKDSILSSCRWLEYVRKSTKTEEFARKNGYGLMPPGQSTDSDFSSTHVQWYYTDTWTLYGITAIAEVLTECGIPEGAHFTQEAEDYRRCFLRSLDNGIIEADELPENIADYDFSAYLFTGPLERDRITEWDENGVPLCLRDHVLTRSQFKAKGLRYFLPSGTTCRVPMDIGYLCNHHAVNSAGMVYFLVDFQSDSPLYEGARHTGKQLWDAIMDTRKMVGVPDYDSDGLAYNEYFLLIHAVNGRADICEDLWEFTRRYGMDPETYMMVEQVGINRREQWFQPCPFALSMANYRRMMERMIIHDDRLAKKISVCRLLPMDWIHRTATYEHPLVLSAAATPIGKMTVSYRADPIRGQVRVEVTFHDPERVDLPVEVYLRHPVNAAAGSVTVNGKAFATDGHSVVLTPDLCRGTVTVVGQFETMQYCAAPNCMTDENKEN